jgi:hypothetical protein
MGNAAMMHRVSPPPVSHRAPRRAAALRASPLGAAEGDR